MKTTPSQKVTTKQKKAKERVSPIEILKVIKLDGWGDFNICDVDDTLRINSQWIPPQIAEWLYEEYKRKGIL